MRLFISVHAHKKKYYLTAELKQKKCDTMKLPPSPIQPNPSGGQKNPQNHDKLIFLKNHNLLPHKEIGFIYDICSLTKDQPFTYTLFLAKKI